MKTKFLKVAILTAIFLLIVYLVVTFVLLDPLWFIKDVVIRAIVSVTVMLSIILSINIVEDNANL